MKLHIPSCFAHWKEFRITVVYTACSKDVKCADNEGQQPWQSLPLKMTQAQLLLLAEALLYQALLSGSPACLPV